MSIDVPMVEGNEMAIHYMQYGYFGLLHAINVQTAGDFELCVCVCADWAYTDKIRSKLP